MVHSIMNEFLLRRFGWIPTRISLGVLSWFGFVNLYMVRINLSVAIVAMVKRRVSKDEEAACFSQLDLGLGENFGGFNQYNDSTIFIYGENNTSLGEFNDNEEGEMSWDETTQGFVLGAFFYGYTLTQIIGGRISELYGTKLVYGGCILAGGISALLTPTAARLHYGALITLRIVQGLLQGASWPSMHACIARWIPPTERPRFIAVVYFASTLSNAITLPMCGVIIKNHGWAAPFYVTGMLSVLWCFFWFTLMHDSPAAHPRISKAELDYIQKALKASGTSDDSRATKASKVPWKSIFTSLPFWAIMAAALGNGWGISLFFAQLPTYMKNVLGFSIKANGAISALPFLSRYVGGIVWSSIGDYLLSHKYLTILATRRIFSLIALLGPGLIIIGVTYAGCDWQITVALFCLALFLNGATTASNLVNHTDIAPNFSGTLLGIDNTLGAIVAFVVPVVTGVMTNGEQTIGTWRNVFWICGPMYIVTNIIYFAFCSGEVQSWNYSTEEIAANRE